LTAARLALALPRVSQVIANGLGVMGVEPAQGCTDGAKLRSRQAISTTTPVAF
jgi:hypothetical protein